MPLSATENPQHLTQLLALAGVGVWRFDHGQQHLTATPEVVNWITVAQSPGATSRLTLADVEAGIHPDDWATVRQLVCPTEPDEARTPVRFRVKGPHGNWLWLEGKSQVTEADALGQPVTTLGVLSNVTDRVLADRHNRLQQAFSDVVTRSPDRPTLHQAMLSTVLALQDLDGGGLYTREADGSLQLVAHQGLEPGFIAEVSQFGPDSRQARWVATGKLLISSATPPGSGEPAASADGPDSNLPNEGFSLLVVLPIWVNGEVGACLNLASTHVSRLPDSTTDTLRDLAVRFGHALERLQAREDAQRQRLHLQTVIDNFPFIAWMKDADGRYLAANHHLLKACGKTRVAEVLGRLDTDIWPADLAQRYRSDDLEVQRSGQTKQVEELLDEAHTRRWVETFKSPVTLEGGAVGTVGFARDISDRKAMEVALEREHSLLKTLVDALPDLFWVKDPNGVYLACNRRFETLYGHTAADIIGKTDLDFVDVNMAEFFRRHDLAAMTKDGPSMNEETLRFASDGHEELLETIKTPVFDSQGQLLGVLGLGRDITARAQAEADRSELLERLQKIAQHVPGVLYQYHLRQDGSSHFPYASHGIEDVYGLSPEAVQADASAVFRVLHPDDLERVTQSIRRSAEHMVVWDDEYRVMHPSHGLRWVHGRAAPQPDGNGGVLWHGHIHDVTHARHDKEQLQLSASVFRHSYDGIMVTDARNTIVKVNPAFTRITGYSAEEAVGQSPRLLSSGRQSDAFYQSLWDSLDEHDHWSGEVWNRRKDGELFAEILSIAVVRDDSGERTHHLGVFSDITRLKSHEAELAHIAQYDALTGLPNRRLLGDRMKVALARTRRGHHSIAICMLDLDGFKDVNDQLGHAAGDDLLVAIAKQLEQVLREGDTLARLGGDEFVLLLADLQHPEQSRRVLDRVLASVSQPVRLGNTLVNVTASVGVTLYPDDDVDADTLLRHADQAMYGAKQAGRNRYHFFDAVQDRMLHAHREQFLRLEQGMANGELVLHYQPKVNLRSGEVLGAEALVRWQHPDRGLLLPADFLHLVAGSPLELDLGRWVLHTALAQASLWQRQNQINLPLSVNVSAMQLLAPEFLDELHQALADHPEVVPEHLELEVLESAAIQDMGRASQVLSRCQALGVRLALDDFGTGYSSLAYFRNLPIDALKIDQSFVRDMLHDPSDLGIVDSVVRLADAFNRPVIAEGVETLEHGAVLLTLGCERMQGYGVSPPIPGDDMPGWMAQWEHTRPWMQLPVVRVPRDRLALYAARRSHERWLAQLLAHVEGGTTADSQSPDAEHCLFGQWYRSSGAARFSHALEFARLGSLHDQVHTVAHDLLALAPSAPPSVWQLQKDRLLVASNHLIQALERLMEG